MGCIQGRWARFEPLRDAGMIPQASALASLAILIIIICNTIVTQITKDRRGNVMAQEQVILQHVTKRFTTRTMGTVTAVDDFNLAIKEGECFSSWGLAARPLRCV